MRCRAPDKICIRGIYRRFGLEVGLLLDRAARPDFAFLGGLAFSLVCPSTLVCPCMPIDFIQEPGFSVR